MRPDDLLLPTSANRPGLRYCWCGPAMLMVDDQGNAAERRLHGFLFRETRYLERLRFTLGDEDPWLCSVSQPSPDRLEFAYTFPPIPGGGGPSGQKLGITERGVDVRLRYRVRAASLEATLRLTSRWDEAAAVDVAWELAADYRSYSGVAGGTDEQEAEVETRPTPDGVRFRYAHERLPYETHVSVEGPGAWQWLDGRLHARLALKRQRTVEAVLRVRAVDFEDPIDAEGEERRERVVEGWQARVVRVYAPGEPPLIEIATRGVHDLGSLAYLDGAEDEWLMPAAGVPRFHSLWGRDALTASWQAGVFDRGDMAAHVLAKLRRAQGTREDDWREEQPGRIVRQLSRGPRERLGRTPDDRYYGDVASPFMFVICLGNAYAWSGSKRLLEENWDAARRVLDWARTHGDRDGDGYIEYFTHREDGPRHQGWKDSDNAVVSADGTQVPPPFAPAEIQGYWHASLRLMAGMAVAMGERGNALALWREAAALRERFNRDFWMDDEGMVCFGLDADKRQVRSVVSNAGHCVAAGIVSDEHVPRVVRRLFEPDMFSGWGIRTLSSKNPSYNPLDYHLGSVWAVENGTILFGLRRYGFEEKTETLARALYDLARLWPAGRIPETVGGYGRDERPEPGAYPHANAPQLWNQSIWPILVQTLLGMRPIAALDLLALDPKLPLWLPELTLKGLRVGGATVDLRFRRNEDGETEMHELHKEGTLHILRQPPIDDLHAGIFDRLGALLQSVLPG